MGGALGGESGCFCSLGLQHRGCLISDYSPTWRHSCRKCSIVVEWFNASKRHFIGTVMIGKTRSFYCCYFHPLHPHISLKSTFAVAVEAFKLRVLFVKVFEAHLLIQHNIYSRELLEKRQTHTSTVTSTTFATTPNRHVITH